MYNISSNQWTWMGGSTTTNQPGLYGAIRVPSNLTIPGARSDSKAWTDSKGTFWLFGGVNANSVSEFTLDQSHLHKLITLI